MRTAFKIVLAFLVLVIVAVVVQYCVAFVRTPGVVARVEQSTDLPLQSSEFKGQRLQWLLQVDDPNFYQHHGVDLATPGAGYTTITQSLTKEMFFNYSFKPGVLRWRKIQQTAIALAFNARVPKDRQLRLFVNLAYMGTRNGRPVIGFAQAAQAYFGKDFKDLTDEEYLALVATIISPRKYSPAAHRLENEQRVARIRRLLAGTCKPASHADVEYPGCAQ